MEWWEAHPDVWKEVTTDAQAPEVVMRDFLEWVKSLGAKPVFVAQPIEFDFTFVCWYLHKFVQENPFSDYTGVQRTLDIASFSAGKFNLPLSHARGNQLPASFREGMPEHSHKAIDDARGYGVILRNILKTLPSLLENFNMLTVQIAIKRLDSLAYRNKLVELSLNLGK